MRLQEQLGTLTSPRRILLRAATSLYDNILRKKGYPQKAAAQAEAVLIPPAAAALMGAEAEAFNKCILLCEFE